MTVTEALKICEERGYVWAGHGCYSLTLKPNAAYRYATRPRISVVAMSSAGGRPVESGLLDYVKFHLSRGEDMEWRPLRNSTLSEDGTAFDAWLDRRIGDEAASPSSATEEP